MQVQSQDPTITFNKQLAEKIIAKKGKDDEYVKLICSEGFLTDPTAHLVHEMIKRRAGRAQNDDGARAFVIGHIPGFIEKVSSPDYLKSFAVQYFKDDPNKIKIMQIFEKSLSSNQFQKDLKSALDKFNEAKNNFYYAESALRIPLTIFRQSAKLQEYSQPRDASLE